MVYITVTVTGPEALMTYMELTDLDCLQISNATNTFQALRLRLRLILYLVLWPDSCIPNYINLFLRKGIKEICKNLLQSKLVLSSEGYT